jgi:hypothetical protein
MQYMGQEYVAIGLSSLFNPLIICVLSGYLESCRSIVSAAKRIAQTVKSEIPELYVLGSPPGPVVAFASKNPLVNVLEVGDAMSKRGWHLNGLSNPAAIHIACTVCALPVIIASVSAYTPPSAAYDSNG